MPIISETDLAHQKIYKLKMFNPSCGQRPRDPRERLAPAVMCLLLAADASCVGAELPAALGVLTRSHVYQL